MNVQVIVPKELFDIEKFKRLQKAQMSATALRVKRELEKTVKTWDDKPTFTIEYSKDAVTIGTDHQIYALVDDGSPAHIIRPRAAKRLKFQNKYRAKTTPGVIGSKKGGPSGDVVTASVVKHPGFQARKFIEKIHKDNDLPFVHGQDQAVEEANR